MRVKFHYFCTMKILMVCLGNICRSPIAEGILRSKIISEGLDTFVDSAGTIALHSGEQPDKRMQATAISFGINISDLRARQFLKEDFKKFDIIYAMDKSNYADLVALADSELERSKIHLILNELEDAKDLEVPDPYFGGEQGFIDVYKMLDLATDKIIDKIKLNG